MNLIDLCKVYRQAFSPEHCERLIEIYETNAAEHYENSLMKFDQCTLNNNDQAVGAAVNIFIDHFNKYRQWLEKNDQKYLPPAVQFENLRIKKYPIDGYFKEHIDAADLASSRRFLSAFVYLNDSGGTKFFNKKINAEVGTLVVFPPQWMFPHTGLVGKKPKYFLSTYLHFGD